MTGIRIRISLSKRKGYSRQLILAIGTDRRLGTIPSFKVSHIGEAANYPE
jgi:hypothetical protein